MEKEIERKKGMNDKKEERKNHDLDRVSIPTSRKEDRKKERKKERKKKRKKEGNNDRKKRRKVRK